MTDIIVPRFELHRSLAFGAANLSAWILKPPLNPDMPWETARVECRVLVEDLTNSIWENIADAEQTARQAAFDYWQESRAQLIKFGEFEFQTQVDADKDMVIFRITEIAARDHVRRMELEQARREGAEDALHRDIVVTPRMSGGWTSPVPTFPTTTSEMPPLRLPEYKATRGGIRFDSSAVMEEMARSFDVPSDMMRFDEISGAALDTSRSLKHLAKDFPPPKKHWDGGTDAARHITEGLARVQPKKKKSKSERRKHLP